MKKLKSRVKITQIETRASTGLKGENTYDTWVWLGKPITMGDSIAYTCLRFRTEKEFEPWPVTYVYGMRVLGEARQLPSEMGYNVGSSSRGKYLHYAPIWDIHLLNVRHILTVIDKHYAIPCTF